ncbi:MAG: flippase-like domain-containing protein [Polyangiaceae bacterium]|nr:flippase-like domain-containing protein [Myxococcales bacterium]MCB9584719.1 flippase-like domain-containing protein [Polyangiaceae bacterium]MCB9607708.1 flippase-like domain-containing protein [Polyangiaceae bacterium]
MSRRARVLWFFVAIAVTSGLLWWMLDAQTLASLGPALKNARWGYIVLGVLLLPPLQWLRAWRFQLLLEGELKRPPLELFRIGVYLVMLNYVLPFKTGELSFPWLMNKRFGTSIGHAAGVLLVSRVVDMLCVMGVAAGCALALLPEWQGLGRGTLWALLLLSGTAILVFPTVARAFHAWAGRLFSRFPGVTRTLDRLLQGVTALRPLEKQAYFLLTTTAIWLVQFGLSYCAGAALGEFRVAEIVLANSTAAVAFALPVNGVVGLGPAQAAWALAIKQLGHPFELGVSTALVWHSTALIGSILLSGVMALVPRGPTVREVEP